MKRARVISFSLCVVLLGTAAPVLADADLLRVPATFPFDAMSVDRVWLEGMVSFESLPKSSTVPKASDLLAKFTGAFAPSPDLEFGAQTALISRNYDSDAFGNPSGLSDTFLWGKYRFGRQSDSAVSVGAFLSVPTGSRHDGLGSGTTDPGVFISGGVHTRGNAFVQGHLGLRWNGEYDAFGVRRNGKASILIGFGGVVPASPGFDTFASFALETERFDGGDSFAQVTIGGRWKISPAWRLQAQAGVGLADAAPRLSLGFGAVYAP